MTEFYKILKYSLFVFFLVLLSACASEETEDTPLIRPVKAIQIGSLEEISRRVFPGTAEATKTADLSFRVAGRVIELPIKKGQEVKEGDLVALLDPRDFDVDLSDARSRLANTLASLRIAKQEYDRAIRIQQTDAGAISQSIIDQRSATVDERQAQVNTAKALVDSVSDKKDYTFLRAPYSGVIVDRFVDNFVEVQAKQKIVRIVDRSMIEMKVHIPENLISFLPDVRNHRVIFDAYPDVIIPAKVKEVNTEASLTTRTYEVTLIMKPPADIHILPGMTGRATGDLSTLHVEQADQVLIPETAVFPSNDHTKTYVWIFDQDSQTVHRREVEKGELSNQGIDVSGVRQGEWIVVAGVHALVEGQKVRLLKQQGNQL